MLTLNARRLVEAGRMIVISDDSTMDYSPAQLRRYLRRYHEIVALCDGAHALRYERDNLVRTDRPDPLRNIHLKRDMDEALGWLQTMDQRAARLVFEHYIGWQGKPTDTATLADRYDLAQRTVHRIISASIQEMARFLGYVHDERGGD